jgi:hypothetical protein
MEAAGQAMIKHYDNKLFTGEMSFYWSEYLYHKWCKLFGHKKDNNFDQWHCDRCSACFEHDKETCEY